MAGRERQGCRVPLLSIGNGESERQVTLQVHDQEIPDCLIKITALGKVETVLRSGIKPGTSEMPFWASSFSL